MNKITEAAMRHKIREIITNKNFGKGKSLNDGIFANKLLSDGVYIVSEAIVNEITKQRRGRKLYFTKVLFELMGDDFIEDGDKVISLSLSLIELVLSKIFLINDSKNLRVGSINNIIKKLLNGDVDNVEHLKTALALFETTIKALPFINVIKRFGINDKTTILYILEPKIAEEIKQVIKTIIDDGFYPLPMTEKPVDWQFINDDDGNVKLVGGYRTLKSKLIRSGKIAMPNEISKPNFLENTKALDALNVVQQTAFRVNNRNLARLKENLKPPIKPIIPEGFREWRKELYSYYEDIKIWKQFENSNPYTEPIKPNPDKIDDFLIYINYNEIFISDSGKYQTNVLALEIAEALKDEERFYFPHNFDYRGRMYPIPVGLSPQGNDVSKGLLEYADSVELTQQGIIESVVYLASAYGYDKLSWNERYKKGMKLLVKGEVNYLDAEEPYIFAQVWDLLQNVNKGDNTSRISIAIDGSCNGLQHMSAITLDKQGGVNVNVSNKKIRYDIYQIIANKAVKLMYEDFKALQSIGVLNLDDKDANRFKVLPKLIEIMEGRYSRAIAKRPVMINPYGGSFNGYKEYVYEALKLYYPLNSSYINAGIITSYINTAMKEDLTGGARYKKWSSSLFKNLARTVNSHLDTPIYFYTPDGFEVRNFQYELKVSQYRIKSLVGRVVNKNIKLIKVTDKVAVRKIGTAIQPNIIHSLDATHLRMTALSMADKGVNQLTFIHDSFGTNPNNIITLNKVTRKTFVELYNPRSKQHPLKLIIKAVEEQTDEVIVPLEQFKGNQRMNINNVLDNEFFFA